MKAKRSLFGKGGADKREEIANIARARSSRSLGVKETDDYLRKEMGYKWDKRRDIMRGFKGEGKKEGPDKEQIKRNIAASKKSEELGRMGKKTGYASSQVSYGGGQEIETSSRVAFGQAGEEAGGAPKRFGLGGGSSGFASQRSNNPAPASPPPSPGPSVGIRPGF